MKRNYFIFFIIFLILAGLGSFSKGRNTFQFTSPSLTPQSKNATNVSIDHIFLIVMENKAEDKIVGSKDAPYINNLVGTYGSLPNYVAITHPSLPNYLAIIGGDTFGVTTDCTDCFFSKNNLIDSLEVAGISWKGYMESLPNTPCFVGDNGSYAQKHNPFIYFDNIRNNPLRCSHIVNFSQFQNDLKQVNTTPNFVWISPNLCHDMHDCSVTEGDTWLSEQIPTILHTPAFINQTSMVIITWDEDDTSQNNHVPFIVIAPKLTISTDPKTMYSHYSLLHTIEQIWKLPSLTTHDANAPVLPVSRVPIPL